MHEAETCHLQTETCQSRTRSTHHEPTCVLLLWGARDFSAGGCNGICQGHQEHLLQSGQSWKAGMHEVTGQHLEKSKYKG